jgi:sugar phosphate isomerase/epimerase
MSSWYRLTRRDFVGTAGAALAGAILGVRATRGGEKEKSTGVRFAVMLPYYAGRSIRERATIVQRFGYQGVEFSMGERSWERSPEFILGELKGIEIEVSAIGGACQFQNPDPHVRVQGIEQDRKCLELAKAVGARQVGEHYLPASDTLKVEDELVVDALKQLAPDVKRTGVEIVLEPLSHENTHFTDLQSHAVRILQAVRAPGFKVVSDFNHMQHENNDIANALTRWGTYTGAVHLPGKKRVGPGSLFFDYRPGFRALKKNGFSGWLTIQCCFAEDDPGPSLSQEFQYVKQHWSEA